MIRAEATVAEMLTGVAPQAGIEYLVRKYTDRSWTVATRPAFSGDTWSPEVSLRGVREASEPGRCTCGFASCSDAGWQR